MDMTELQTDLEDLIVWPDGTNCFRYELHEMTHMSDDFLIYYYGTESYDRKYKEIFDCQ